MFEAIFYNRMMRYHLMAAAVNTTVLVFNGSVPFRLCYQEVITALSYIRKETLLCRGML